MTNMKFILRNYKNLINIQFIIYMTDKLSLVNHHTSYSNSDSYIDSNSSWRSNTFKDTSKLLDTMV